MSQLTMEEMWNAKVSAAIDAHENFNDFIYDRLIIWADERIKRLQTENERLRAELEVYKIPIDQTCELDTADDERNEY